jgi:hypothetical protein
LRRAFCQNGTCKAANFSEGRAISPSKGRTPAYSPDCTATAASGKLAGTRRVQPRNRSWLGSINARCWLDAACVIRSQHREGATRDSAIRLKLSLLRLSQPPNCDF